jgi:hypothetical protein
VSHARGGQIRPDVCVRRLPDDLGRPGRRRGEAGEERSIGHEDAPWADRCMIGAVGIYDRCGPSGRALIARPGSDFIDFCRRAGADHRAICAVYTEEQLLIDYNSFAN